MEPALAARESAPMGFAAALGSGDEERDEGLAGEIDEVQTKLDLAQTYIDMEDYDDARSLLHDVQAEGDPEQRAIAHSLASKIP